METYIKGTFSRSIYESSSGYMVGVFRVIETNQEDLSHYVGRTIPFTGYFHELNTFDTYQFFGKVVQHEKYGEQFQVDRYERCVPEEKDGIVNFLSSDLFKGIGEKKAKAIVDVLGKDTLKIILENPNNLILIPGITEKNIQLLHSQLKEYESSYEIIVSLTEKGFSSRDAMILYNYYKKRTIEVFDENPYQFILDIYDMHFKKIDQIALKNNMEKDHPYRIQAAILYVMEEVSNTYGHSYYSRDEIAFLLPRVLGLEISYDLLTEAFEALEKDSRIVIREDKYYLRDMYDAECLIVKRIRILSHNPDQNEKGLDDEIHHLETFFGITYNPQQLDAIRKSYLKDFLIVTGGPGTGKTTIMKAMLELYRQMNHLSYERLQEKVALLAPTGRAAKRMSEATMFPASTIHRFLKWQKEQNRFQVNEYNKSKIEFLILDESSMIDTYLMAHLLRGISSNCKIVMVGDDHQLPSVGPGQVLHDVIQSKAIEVVELTELYRQGKDSHIIHLAYDIRHKNIQRDIFNVSEDLTFIECPDSDVMNQIREICQTYQEDSYHDFQILAPMYKGLCGIDEINRVGQSIFNPKSSLKKEYRIGEVDFLENDKVIQLTNMPEDNVYNGDIGLIDQIKTNPKKEILIDFDGNVVKYTPTNFMNFRLAYAISIHKSQGSEFDVVVIPCVKGYRKMLYQKLIYTAVTRAKQKLYLIGDMEALEMAACNTYEDERRTTICDFLVSGIK